MSRRPAFGLLLSGLLLSALPASSFAQSPSPAAGIEGVEWHLSQVAGSGVPFITVPAGVDATLQVHGAQANGKGGCNSWFADVKVDGDAIVFGPIGSTMMACPEPAMGFETQYLHLLGEVQRWAITDGTLQLADAGGAVLLVFASAPTGTPEGVDWRVGELTVNGTRSVIPAGIDVTLRMDAGQASGDGGCNRYFGGYSLTGTSLTFGPMASTEMACPEPRMSIESAWLTDLGLVTGWTIADGRLQLLDAAGTPLAVLDAAAAATLEGTWALAEVSDAKGALALVKTDATVTFGADGTLSGTTGCNTLNASYLVDGTTIKVGPVATTRMACKDADAQSVETALLAALGGATIWHINADGWLELSNEAGQLLAGFTPSDATMG